MRRLPRVPWAVLVMLTTTAACSGDRSSNGGAASGGSASGGEGALGGAQPRAGASGEGGSSAGRDGASGSGGASGAEGGAANGGASGAQGGAANGGASGAGGGAANGGASGAGGGSGEPDELAKFSFFVTSMQAIATLSGTDINEPEGFGFGGDLRFGKADGLAGADEICRQAAELGMPRAGEKTWRAFLSVFGPPAVNARDRIGPGPWYDARGRLVAENLTALLDEARPQGDARIANDLPNERGEPNHYVGPTGYTPSTTWDNHDTLTGSDTSGNLTGVETSDTCEDWTSSHGLSATGPAGPRVGHSWPRTGPIGRGAGWASDHRAPGCALGYSFEDSNLPADGNCVGCAGGYGAIYCFALATP